MRDLERVYNHVNAAWPKPSNELPDLDGAEAISAVKRLWRVAVGRKAKQKFRLTSGNRRNRRYSDVWIVNPDAGWWNLVHHVSHRAHAVLHPRARPHDPQEAYLERRLIEHVVNSGWLDGKLKRPTKEPKPKPDVREVRAARVLTQIESWERKRKRAETALKKLYAKKRYYERSKKGRQLVCKIGASVNGESFPVAAT